MNRRIYMIIFAALFLVQTVFASEAEIEEKTKKSFSEMAKLYKPGHFDSSTFYWFFGSHNDIAHWDDPKSTADYRAEHIISPTLDLMQKEPSFCFDFENVLYIKEYLDRHPERIEEVKKRIAEGRLKVGGTYTQFFEAVYGGEALARQLYFGRKWLKKTLGPQCDTHLAWDTDIPQRTLQSPQVLSKAGIKYLMIGRLEPVGGIYVWQSPDGSSVMFNNFHYIFYILATMERVLQRTGVRGTQTTNPPEEVVESSFKLLNRWEPFFKKHNIPHFVLGINGDYEGPCSGYIKAISIYNNSIEKMKKEYKISPPTMKITTAERYLDLIKDSKPYLKVYDKDRPSPWCMIHQPSHERLLSVSREAYHLLVSAEKFGLIASLLDPEDKPYPQEKLTSGWEGLIYPDHGFCGEKVTETMRVFSEKLHKAYDAGRDVYETSTEYIAKNVKRTEENGTPIVVFNPLSWERTGPVSCKVSFDWGELKTDELVLGDSKGNKIPCQISGKEQYIDNTLSEITLDFIAQDVPSVGYKTYYLTQSPVEDKQVYKRDILKNNVIENKFYKLKVDDQGIVSLYDKEIGFEGFDTKRFRANQPFIMGVKKGKERWAFPGEGTYNFYEELKGGLETMPNFGKLKGDMKIELTETGPVKTVVVMHGDFDHVKLYQQIVLYNTIKRIDLSTDINWDGTKKRELRLSFPVNIAENPQISYDVPFGVVEVGKNELGWSVNKVQMSMPREVQNFVDVSNGQYGVTLAVGKNCVTDIRDRTEKPLKPTFIQPLLLTTLHSFRRPHQKEELSWWIQKGHHSYDFSLSTHHGTWKNNWRFGWEFSNPLKPVVLKIRKDSQLAQDQNYGKLPEEYSFCSVDKPNVVISTIKKCEDDDDVIVRYFDMEGKDSQVQIDFFKHIDKAEMVNIIEEEPKDISLDNGKLKIESKAYSIDTVKFNIND